MLTVSSTKEKNCLYHANIFNAQNYVKYESHILKFFFLLANLLSQVFCAINISTLNAILMLVNNMFQVICKMQLKFAMTF